MTGPERQWNRSLRFWGIFVALCILSFISALDVSIVATALPTITKNIGGEDDYIWIANSFVLASSVPQPLFGQISNIFGRRYPTILAILLFALGSGIAGGAATSGMLIAGRSVQGVGAGGIYVLIDIICCDLVPLRQRGQYLGYMFTFAGVGALIGPVVGGALALKDWRWIFYMNIPISGLALGVVLIFLQVNYERNRTSTWRQLLLRIDFIGGTIFIGSITAVLFGLVMGGVRYAWSSWHIVTPLVIGIAGWIAFHAHQASRFCAEPSVPPRLFQNRTSATAILLAFISSMVIQIITYFLPVYFQAVLGTSALRSGIHFLPFAILSMVFAVVGGTILSKSGLYRLVHWAGFALSSIGLGLFILLDNNTSKATWAGFQIIAAAGSGLVLSTILPAIMASLAESDTAVASSAYSFTRTFGQIWGISMASIIFNDAFNSRINIIQDPKTRLQLADGAAYAYASQQFVPNLPPETREQVTEVYTKALRIVWWLSIGLSIFAFLCVFVEKDIELRSELETEFGLHKKAKLEPSDKEEKELETSASLP